MTKSKGVGRGKGGGGKKPGAGRRKKFYAPMVLPPEILEAADETIRIISESNEPASGMVALAYATLKHVLAKGVLDGPRVTAATAIIELAKAEKTTKATGPAGKKAAEATAGPQAEAELEDLFGIH